MFKHYNGVILLLLILLLVACNTTPGAAVSDTDEQGRIMLWHTWSGADEQALNRLVERFNDVYPDIQVISISYAPDELKDQFSDTVTRGLGPDIMIGSQLWIPDLADAGLIYALDEDRLDLASFLTPALNTLRYKGDLYGLPLSLQTSALYYNKKLVDEPPDTLEALLEQVEEGEKVAINTNFEDAFWGIQAFGGQLLDDERRVVLNQGGFANWLDWLIEAQNIPNVILSKDEEVLNNLFAESEVSYYVGSSSDLLTLQEALGENAVGVSPLPAGPNDSAGPFLTTEPFFFNTASSPIQRGRAMLLVDFLSNTEQQRKLAQQTGRIPANEQARVNRRISPAVAGFVDQTKTAIPLLLIPQLSDAIQYGQDTYLQTLEGLLEPTEAAILLADNINQRHGLETVEVMTEVTCDANGIINIWHSWPEQEAAALVKVGESYTELCPRLKVKLIYIDEDELIDRYLQAVDDGAGPDLVLAGSENITRLASNELVGNLSDVIPPDFLQRYIPSVPETMRYEGSLFGLPLTMDTMALFYNGFWVNEAPIDLGDLLGQIGADRQMAISYTPFDQNHWGLPAFGGRLFDVDGNLALQEGGFAEWLQWLQDADKQPGMIVTRNPEEAEALFVQGQVAYLPAERSRLSALQQEMGNLVRVAPLPAGPEGASGPLLTVQGLMLNPESLQTEAAIEFAKYAIGTESQKILMREGNLAPANISVSDPHGFPAIAGFVEQAATAVAAPNRTESATIFGLGDIIYKRVLVENAEPIEVLSDFTTFFNKVYEDENQSIACDDEGQLLLWHSKQGAGADVLDQAIAEFARKCPGILMEAVFVPEHEMPDQLAASMLVGNGPDLLLSPHDLIVPLSESRLIKPITPLISNSTLIPYLPQALQGMKYDEAMFGLPYSMDTMALYYNTDLIDEPADTFFDLFTSTTITSPLAMDTSFAGAFWGTTAVFGSDSESIAEQALNPDQPYLDLKKTTLSTWLSWLNSNKTQPGIVMSGDQQRLQEQFAVGNAAYLISGPDALIRLRAELDSDDAQSSKIGVTTLPSGPGGEARPLLMVDGFLFSAAADEKQTEMALKFAECATSSQSQITLVQGAGQIPANVLAQTSVNDNAIDGFIQQTELGILHPPRSEGMILGEGGDLLYRNVLENDQTLSVAVAEFLSFVEETPRPSVVAYTGERVLSCEESGRLLLWHNWPFAAPVSGDEDSASEDQVATLTVLDRMITKFTEHCPDVAIDTEYVSADELPAKLSAATAAGVGPDIMLTRHDLIKPLADENAIQPITAVADSVLRDQYEPKWINALEYEGELYGLPQNIDTMSLFYNSDLVTSTVSMLDDLLAVASPERQVALDSSFYGASWGVGSFDGRLFDEQGQPLPEQTGLENWLTWLQTAQQQPGIVLSADQAELQQLFIDGEAAYLVAGPESLTPLREALGESVRVIPLPAGPDGGEASPLVLIDAFLFKATEDEAQIRLGLKFAEFASSSANQTLLALEADLIPSNLFLEKTIEDPALRNFVEQAVGVGIVLPVSIDTAVLAAGDNLYNLTFIEGELPSVAVSRFIEAAGVQ